MARYIDLHLHTNLSDGVLSPEELLDLVRDKNLEAFSITDHDNLEGFLAVKKLLKKDDPELIPGVELSVSSKNGDLHILAYCFDSDNMVFNRTLNDFKTNRNQRGRLIVQKLNELGIDITYEDVSEYAGSAAVGRPHIALAMLNRKYISRYEEAFVRYIGNNKPAYVPKKNMTPVEAIKLIHSAGGIAVLAHPMIDNACRHIEALVGLGLDGIEIYHPSNRQSDGDRLKQTAERFRLVTTGGSDYHGLEDHVGMIGSQKVPVGLLVKFKEKCQFRRIHS